METNEKRMIPNYLGTGVRPPGMFDYLYKKETWEGLTELQKLNFIMTGRQMRAMYQDMFERAKKMRGKAPGYSEVTKAVETVARYPIATLAEKTNTFQNRWMEFVKLANRRAYERSGLFEEIPDIRKTDDVMSRILNDAWRRSRKAEAQTNTL